MKKFKFRLETVLELKIRELDEKALEIAKITTGMNNEIEKKQNIIHIRGNIIKNLENIYQSGQELNIINIQNNKNYIEILDRDEKLQEELIKQFEKLLEQKRNELEEIHKEKKVLEKLKEKKELEHYKEIQYQENKEMEDISSGRYKKA